MCVHGKLFLVSEMSSIPTPPPPPPPPGAPSGENTYTFRAGESNDGSNDLGKYGEVHGTEVGKEQSCCKQLGHSETRDITKENFLDEVCGLVRNRMGPGASDIYTDSDPQVKLVVTAQLKKALLQNGPMCGIVALAEAIQILKRQEIDTTAILQEAVRNGYTKQGEMFSITEMNNLAKTFGNSQNSEVVDTTDKSHFQKIISHVLQGYPILFPYDADYNHSPSLRKGHAAHWAVIYGLSCYISQEQKEFLMNDISESFKVLKSSPEAIIVQPLYFRNETISQQSSLQQKFSDVFKYESLHVIAHQGKSYHLALWNYNDLVKSNQNLKEIAPKILANKSDFICKNIIDGLCSKILLLK